MDAKTALEIVLKAHEAGERADLYGADLRGANLYGADLYGVDLRGANLCEADLYGVDLRGANLCEADLCGADLRGANLYGADLYGADLCGADLRGAEGVYVFGGIGEFNRIGYAWLEKDVVVFGMGCYFGNAKETVKAIRAKYGKNSLYEKQVLLAEKILLEKYPPQTKGK